MVGEKAPRPAAEKTKPTGAAMGNHQVLLDCDNLQGVPGVCTEKDTDIIPSGKAFNYIPKQEREHTIYGLLRENCDIHFLTEEEPHTLSCYPVPLTWFFAYDSSGNYFGTLKEMGDIENQEIPVVYFNHIKRTYGKIAETMREFFSLVNFHPYWRRIIASEHHEPLNAIERMKNVTDKLYFERQGEIGAALNLSNDVNAIDKLIERLHGDSGFMIYDSKEQAEKTYQFVVL